MASDFCVKKSESGYRVQFCRDGQPHVTFVDGLTELGAERQARELRQLWRKIQAKSHADSGSVVDQHPQTAICS